MTAWLPENWMILVGAWCLVAPILGAIICLAIDANRPRELDLAPFEIFEEPAE